jgi:hypothetical protein
VPKVFVAVVTDAELSMRDHVARTAQTCFYRQRRLCPVHRQLGCDVTAQLVSALGVTRLDCCNSFFSALRSLQRVMNAAAKTGARPAASRPCDRQWRSVEHRIICKLCLQGISYHAINGRAPAYLRNFFDNRCEHFLASVSVQRAAHQCVPATGLELGERALSVSDPKAFNDLPSERKICRNAAVFKRKFKTFLFNKSLLRKVNFVYSLLFYLMP